MLGPSDRARPAEELLASLEEEPEAAAEIDAAWESEIRNRVASIRDGSAQFIPAEDVYAETRRIYKK